MAQELVVRIIGDASSLERAMKQSAVVSNKFGRDMNKTFRGVVAGSGAFRSLGRSVAFASSSFLGGVGLTAVIKSSVSAASDLAEQVEKSDVVFGRSSTWVEDWSKTLATAFGISDRAALTAASSFAALLEPMGVSKKAAAGFSEQLVETAADLASFFNLPIQDALDALTSGLVGQVRPLRRFGINLTAARVAQEALIETGKKNAKNLTEQEKATARLALIQKDSANAQGDFARTSGHLAQQLKISQANIENLQGALGTTQVPAITGVVTQLNSWIGKSENQKRVTDDVKQAVDAATGVLKTLQGVLEDVNRVTGSTKDTVKLLFEALVLYKTAKLVSTFANLATNIGLIGANARNSRRNVRLLNEEMGAGGGGGKGGGRFGGLGAGAGLGAALVSPELFGAVFASELIKNTKAYREFRKVVDKPLGVAALSLTEIPKAFLGDTKNAIDAWKRLLGLVNHPAVRAPAGALGPVGGPFPPAGALGPTGLLRAGAAGRPGHDPNAPGEIRSREAARQRVADLAAFAVEKTALTKGIADDIAANEKLNALLLRRIKGGHDTIDIQRQQLQVQLTLNDLFAQQAQAAKAARQAAQEAAKAGRDARQFRLLGFGPGGEDLIPGIKVLRRQLASVNDVIKGSFLDTGKTRGLLGHIRQVLSGGLGSVSDDVRAKIQGILADLKGQLKQSSVDVTRFQKTARGQFALAGAHPGGMVVNIAHFHSSAPNAKQIEEELTHRHRQRAHSRRSTR